MRQSFLILLGLIFLGTVSFAQKSTISGIISDAGNKEPLVGATVYVNQSGAISDFDGRYELSLNNGKYTLVVSYVGYEPLEQEIDVTGDRELNFELESSQK